MIVIKGVLKIMENKRFKNIVFAVIISSIASIILGIVMIMMPTESLVVFSNVLACFFIASGISLIVLDIRARHYYLPFHAMLLGALCLVIGFTMLMHPENIFFILAFTLGMWVIISSVEDIRTAFILKDTGIPFVLILILNIINIIAGVYMLANPAASSISIALFCGIEMIVNGIIRIVDMLMIKSYLKDAKKYIKEISEIPQKELERVIENEKKPEEIKIEDVKEEVVNDQPSEK